MFNQMRSVGWNTTAYQVRPDFVAIAMASSCHGRRVGSVDELRPALEEALSLNRQGMPVVIDVPTGLDMSHFERAE